MKDITNRNLIVETTIRLKPSQRRLTHKLIGETRFPFHRYHTTCGLSLPARQVRVVLAREPTCKNCHRWGARPWRFTRSN